MTNLFSTLGAADYLMVSLVCLFASTLSGMSGFGGGMIISVFIAPIIGVEAVVPVMSVLMLFTNGFRVWIYLRSLDWRITLLIVSTSIPSVLLGSLFYVSVDTGVIGLLLGAILIASVPLRRYLDRRKVVVSPGAMRVFGIPYGFLGGTAIGAGMLLIPILLGAGLAGPALLATDAAIAVAMNVAKVLVFGRFEALDLQLFAAGVLMGLCTIPGTWAASWIVTRTSIRVHTLFMEALVLAGGTMFIYQGLQ